LLHKPSQPNSRGDATQKLLDRRSSVSAALWARGSIGFDKKARLHEICLWNEFGLIQITTRRVILEKTAQGFTVVVRVFKSELLEFNTVFRLFIFIPSRKKDESF